MKVFGFLFIVVVGICMLVYHCGYGLALSRFAEWIGYHNGMLAWIPGGNYWLMGALSDELRFRRKGERQSKAIVLAVEEGLYLAAWVYVVVIMIRMAVLSNSASRMDMLSQWNAAFEYDHLLELGSIGLMAAFVLWIARNVSRCFALYDLFSELTGSRKRTVILLAVSFVIPAAAPVLLILLLSSSPELEKLLTQLEALH